MKFLTIFQFIALVALAKGEDDGKIVGGFETTIDQVPYQAALVTLSNEVFCGGTVISPTWILTAAHCMPGVTTSNIRIRVASSDYATGGQLLPVSRLLPHPQFNKSIAYDYDIALIGLSRAIVFNRDVRAARLPNTGVYPADGAGLWISGWGHEQSGGTPPRKIRTVQVNVVNRSTCRSKYNNLTGNMICASADGKDTCQGDSGGPLVKYDTQTVVGITSFGYGCASPGYPGVYGNVAAPEMRSYIRSNTGL